MSYSVTWSAADVTEKSGRRPPGRFANAYTRYGSSAIVLHGGCCWMKGRKFRFLDDMWVLKISMPGWISWEALGQRGQVPGTRAYHHLCYLSRRLYLFGGKRAMEDKRVVPGIHVYDYSAQCWYQQHVDGAEHPFRLGCSASVVDDQIFTFGGMLDGKVTAATHLFDPQASSWSALQPSGSIPPARCDHGACTMKSSIFVHGGCAGADVFLCDLYELDTNTLLWTRLEFGGISNIPRAGHSLTAHHGKDLYVFGGFNDHIYPDGGPVTEDLCKYSLRQKRWKTPLAFPVEYEPSITYNHSAVIVQNCLYIVGGLALDGMANDVQIARLISPSERTMAPEEVRMKAFDSGFNSSGIYDTPPAPIVDEIYSAPLELPDIERRRSEATSSRSVDSTEVRSCSRASLDPVVSEIFIEPAAAAPGDAVPEKGPRRLSSPPPNLTQSYDEVDQSDRGSRMLKSPPPGLSRENEEDDNDEGGQFKLRSPPPGPSREENEDVREHRKLKSPPPGLSRENEEDGDEGGQFKLRSPPPGLSRENEEDDNDEGGQFKLRSPPPGPSREENEDVREHRKLKSPPPSPSKEDGEAEDENVREYPKLRSPSPNMSREDDEDAFVDFTLKSPRPGPSREDAVDERGCSKSRSPSPGPSREDEGGLLRSPPPSASDLESGRRAPEPPESVSDAEDEKERKDNATKIALQNLNALTADREVREEDASTTSDNASSSDSSDDNSSSGVEEEEEEEEEEEGEKEKREEDEDEFSFSISKRPKTAKPDEDGRAWSEDIYDELEAPGDTDNGNADEDDSEQSGDEPTLTPEERQQLEQLSAQVSSK